MPRGLLRLRRQREGASQRARRLLLLRRELRLRLCVRLPVGLRLRRLNDRAPPTGLFISIRKRPAGGLDFRRMR